MKIEVHRVYGENEWNVRIDGILACTVFSSDDIARIHAGLILLDELADGLNKHPLIMATEILAERSVEDGDREACPNCGRKMQNMGNVSGVDYLTYPPMWEEVWVCHVCKVKKRVSMRGDSPAPPDLSDYKEVE